MELNKKQKYIVDEAVKFYKQGNEQVFQISGNPGTGKSVVLNAIADRLGLNRERIAPMAFMGAAAIVMRLKGMYNARTIHSWLYTPVDTPVTDKLGNTIMDEYFNRPKMHLGFEPKPLSDKDIIFIDEGGMVPYSLKNEIESRGLPIIVAGDRDQLDPVMDKPAYLSEGKIYVLDEIMRQAENSAIIYLSQRAKNGLPIHNGYYGNVLVIYEDELSPEMILSSNIIICGKNATRDKYNKYVRQDLLNIYSDIPMYGEKVVCRKNNWNIDIAGINLANGLTGSVVNWPDVSSFDGKTFKIDFKPDLLNIPFQGLTCDYRYFTAEHAARQYIKKDPYSTGEKFELAYAITTHMSQGSEYNKGIYIEEYMGPDITKKLNFVGISRFKQSCTYVKKRRKIYY